MQIQASLSNENDDYSPKTRFSSYPKMTLTKDQPTSSRVSFLKDIGSGSLPRSKTIVNGRTQRSFYGKSAGIRGNNNQNHNRAIDFNNNEDFEVKTNKVQEYIFFS